MLGRKVFGIPEVKFWNNGWKTSFSAIWAARLNLYVWNGLSVGTVKFQWTHYSMAFTKAELEGFMLTWNFWTLLDSKVQTIQWLFRWKISGLNFGRGILCRQWSSLYKEWRKGEAWSPESLLPRKLKSEYIEFSWLRNNVVFLPCVPSMGFAEWCKTSHLQGHHPCHYHIHEILFKSILIIVVTSVKDGGWHDMTVATETARNIMEVWKIWFHD